MHPVSLLPLTFDSSRFSPASQSNHLRHLSSIPEPGHFSPTIEHTRTNMMDYPPDPPIQDDLKPDLPYIPGAVLDIQEFRPHLPFGVNFQDETSRIDHTRPWKQCDTASRFCLQNPPLTGRPIAHPKTRTIIIDSQIACGDGRGSQLVKCHSGDNNTPLVAKIYDPLYYRWPEYDDITYQADEQFTTEATVYMTLQDMDKDYTIGYPRVRKVLKGSIPRYYGSYTWETQLLDGQRRQVRLILMEYIPFPSMRTIIREGRVADIPAKVRMQLLAKAFEIFAWLEYYGIDQNDFAPRNIMVDPDQGRVVLLDFSIAEMRDLYNSTWSTRQGQLLPTGPKPPLEKWHGGWAGMDAEGWVPKDLHPAQARYNWFLGRWGDSKVFQPLSHFWYQFGEPHLRADIEREGRFIKGRVTDSSESQTDEY